jgi:hypothetical protein
MERDTSTASIFSLFYQVMQFIILLEVKKVFIYSVMAIRKKRYWEAIVLILYRAELGTQRKKVSYYLPVCGQLI